MARKQTAVNHKRHFTEYPKSIHLRSTSSVHLTIEEASWMRGEHLEETFPQVQLITTECSWDNFDLDE